LAGQEEGQEEKKESDPHLLQGSLWYGALTEPPHNRFGADAVSTHSPRHVISAKQSRDRQGAVAARVTQARRVRNSI
jgi:hypothetical protein